MANAQMRDQVAVDVTFTLDDEYASSVRLVGEFNDWSTEVTPMERDGDGFAATVALITGRDYRYKFLVDDESWRNDPNADDYVANEYGGHDSVRRVPAAASHTEALPPST